MNEAVVPAAVAVTGGSAALAAIYVRERAMERSRRANRQAFRLTFPVGVTDRQTIEALAELTGAGPGFEFVFEIRATSAGIEYFIHASADVASPTCHQLSAAVPGLRTDIAGRDHDGASLATLALRFSIPSLSMLRTDGVESTARSVLSQLGQLNENEHVRIFFAVRSVALRLPDREPTTVVEREEQRRLRKRLGQPTFGVAGLVVAKATSTVRARALVDGVGQALRSRSADARPLRLVYDRAGRRLASMPKVSRRSAVITAAELAGLLSWPLGEEPIPQVARGATRQMPVPRDVGLQGVRLFVGRDQSGERAVRLPVRAQRLHVFAIGPTGSGKSTLSANVVLDALADGQAGLVLDPKDGTLIKSILDRVPRSDRERVVVVDPADLRMPVGLNLFAAGDADTRAEAITGTLRAIFAPLGAWGVRSDFFVGLGVRSLAVLEEPSLMLIGRLFADPGLRQQVVGRLKDPVLQMAWSAFNDLTPEAQREQIAAPLNRLMSLLQRPALRAAIAQPSPKLDLGRAWDERKWVLVNLSPGTMGEGAARLLGAICGYLTWSTLEARAGRPASARIPTNLVFDELQAISDVPVSIERLAERARAYGGQLLLATQAVSRLPTPLADAIFGNFATILTFRPGAHEAQRLAREFPGLKADDLMSLPPYGVAARVATGSGSGVVTLTGRTESLPPVTGNAAFIRSRSAGLYGTPRRELDEAIARQLGGDLPGAPQRPEPGRGRRAS